MRTVYRPAAPPIAALLATLVGLTLASCASPELRDQPRAGASTPLVITRRGALDEAGSRLVLRRAVHSAEATAAAVSPDADIDALLDAIRSEARAPFTTGNDVQALIDGPQTLDAIGGAIENARHHIHIETYILADDEVGQRLAEQLKRKRAEGVEVRVLYDAVGSLTTSAAYFDDLRAHGIEVLAFRPLDPVRTPLLWKVNNRDHRKIIVVDGATGFTGGINLSSTYSQASLTKPGPKAGLEEAWRDTHVVIRGPAVAQLQTLFLGSWTRAGGEGPTTDERYYPPVTAPGRLPVAIVASDGEDPREAAIYGTYLAAIRHAKRRIWLTQAYFSPNAELKEALLDAVRRGVDVRVIVPGFTDSGLIFHAARAHYDDLLSGGVQLFEQRDALVHAKTAVVDGIVSTVGSANLDMRSFVHNNEANAVIVSRDFGRLMERTFERDRAAAQSLTLATWRARGILPRLKEFGSRLFAYWL